MTDPTHTITQTQVQALLERLQQLHQRIHTIRQELAPIEQQLTLVYKEYQAAIGHLQRENYQLQTKITHLQALLDGSNPEPEDKEKPLPPDPRQPFNPLRVQVPPLDPKDLAKDLLHEHIYMVLDDEDDELLAHLQAMCSDSTTRLVDVLEQIPWGVVWTSPTTSTETPAEHYQRLATWEQALQEHLHTLEQARARSQSDRRYGLWQQYRKGPQSWSRFLQETISRMQDHNDELHLELQRLSELQAAIGDEHE